MGELRGSVQQIYVRRLGKAKWHAHVRTVNELWKQIRRMIDDLDLDFNHVRVYQDGLPVCDHEERIVRELALKGSANHRLLVDLMDRGAHLTGTESPQLLIAEYEHNRRILGAPGEASSSAINSPEIQQQARQLLHRRDRFIAGRIAETLQSAEQGMIFLGMLHSLEGLLPDDVRLTILRPGDPKPRLPSRTR